VNLLNLLLIRVPLTCLVYQQIPSCILGLRLATNIWGLQKYARFERLSNFSKRGLFELWRNARALDIHVGVGHGTVEVGMRHLSMFSQSVCGPRNVHVLSDGVQFEGRFHWSSQLRKESGSSSTAISRWTRACSLTVVGSQLSSIGAQILAK
jgi:hypothetical protein